MHVFGYDLTRNHVAIKVNLIGKADIGVETFLVPAKYDIWVLFTENLGHHKFAWPHHCNL
jgi:hypothetical protein